MTFLVALSGMLAQFVDGILGMGYGVSAATLLLALGMAPAVVSATVHAAKLPTSAVSAFAHGREGNVDRAIAVPLGIGGVIGGVIGAFALARVATGDVKPLVAIVLLGLGVRLFWCGVKGRSARHRETRLTSRQLTVLGVVGGALDAFGGGGWGPTCTSVLMSTDGREGRRQIGSVNAAELATALAIVVTFVATAGVEPFAWKTALPLIAGGMVAAPFAARVCARVNARVLAAGVGVTLVALNSSTLASYIGVKWLQPALWSVSVVAAAVVVVFALHPVLRSQGSR